MSERNFQYYAGSPSGPPPPYNPLYPGQVGTRRQYGAVIRVVPDERDSLLQGKRQNGRSCTPLFLVLVAVAFMFFAGGYYANTISHEIQLSQWAKQKEQHEKDRLIIEDERFRWDLERKRREDEANMEREEYERKRRSIYWSGLAPLAACSKYKIREYSATLTNVVAGLDAMEECKSKAIRINGQDLLPSHCEDQGICGKVTGHWEVEERYCTPYFSVIEDHGCYRPGGHQYKGKLDDIQDWINWVGICMSMPGPSYKGVELGLPYYCSPAAGGSKGYWAEWMVADPNCH